jgi:hypothetical protein
VLFDTFCYTNDGDVEHYVIGGEEDEDKVGAESRDDSRLCDDDYEVDADEEVFIKH